MDKDEFSRQARDATQSLYRVACAYLASPPDRDDAVQEALLRAWEKRRTLREEQYFKTWLTRILIRVCVDMQRRKKRVIVSDNLPEQIAPEPPDPLLREAIEQLEPTLRAAVVLYYLEGYSVREIAAMTEATESAVKNRLARARQRLRTELTGQAAQ